MSDAPEQPTTFLPGDPSQWSPAERTRHERMAAFLRALQEEGMVTPACKVSGVDQATVWRWREQYPAFSQAVTRFMTRTRVQVLEENMYRIACSDDPKVANAAVRANEFLLRSWDRDTYDQAQRIEQTVTINQQVQVVHEVRERNRQRQAERLRTIEADAVRSDMPGLLPEAQP